MASCLNITFRRLMSSCGLIALAICLPGTQFAAEPSDTTGTADRDELIEQLPPGFMDSTSTLLAPDTIGTRKSPVGALLRSAAVPGWGQIYAERYVWGVITGAVETAFIAGMVVEFRDWYDLRDRLSALERERGPDWPVDDPLRVELNNRISSARRKAGDYMTYGATAMVLGMLDAYVSAHLHNFDRHFTLAPSGRGGLALGVKF